MSILTEYKALSLKVQPHSFCSSVIFTSLLTRLGDADQFAELFAQLFGEQGMMPKLLRLQADLALYQQGAIFPASLSTLVQQHFLPKLANHLRTHGNKFLLLAKAGSIFLSLISK